MSRRAGSKRRRNSSSGFTLIELIVASLLSSIVLMGMFYMMTNMVTAEVNSMRTGTVTAWSLSGLNAMNSDIAFSGAFAYPSSGGSGSDSLVVCTNWKTWPATNMPVHQGVGNTVYNYCWDQTDAPPSPFANALLRHATVNQAGHESCSPTPLGCSASAYLDGANPAPIIVSGVYKDAAGDHIFYVDPDTLNAVRVRFQVGNWQSGTSAGSNPLTLTPSAVPVTVPVDTKMILED